MKKTYINPQTQIFWETTELMLAASPQISINNDDSVNAADVDVKSSHNYDVWDDDWSGQ